MQDLRSQNPSLVLTMFVPTIRTLVIDSKLCIIEELFLREHSLQAFHVYKQPHMIHSTIIHMIYLLSMRH